MIDVPRRIRRLGWLLPHMLRHGHWRLALYAVWCRAVIWLRWVFAPQRAIRLVLEHAEALEEARRRRRVVKTTPEQP